MICEMRHIIIRVASNGTAMICSTDREGMEKEVLKEKSSDEMYRNYYCSNCMQSYKGEEIEDWDIVQAHFGTKPIQIIPSVDIEPIELNDTSMPPHLRKSLRIFNETPV